MNVYKCAKNIRKMKWYPIIRILLYLRDIETKEIEMACINFPQLGGKLQLFDNDRNRIKRKEL